MITYWALFGLVYKIELIRKYNLKKPYIVFKKVKMQDNYFDYTLVLEYLHLIDLKLNN